MCLILFNWLSDFDIKHSEIICGHRWCYLPPERVCLPLASSWAWRGSRHRSLTPSGPGLCVCSSVSSGLLIPRVYPLQGSNWTPRGLTRSYPLWQALNSNLSSPDPCVCWNMDSTPELPLLELAVAWRRNAVQFQAQFFGLPCVPISGPHEPSSLPPQMLF